MKRTPKFALPYPESADHPKDYPAVGEELATKVENLAAKGTPPEYWELEQRLATLENALGSIGGGGNAYLPIVCTSTTRPSTPFEGQVIRETDTNKELTYSGSAWVQTNSWGTTSGVTGVNNLIVPPAVGLELTSNKTSWVNNAAISWDSELWDTDGLWSSGSTITIQTTGIYLVTAQVQMTAATSLTAGYLFTDSGQVYARGENNSVNVNLSYTQSYSAGHALAFYAGYSAVGAVTLSGSAGFRTTGKCSITWIGRTS